MAVQLNSIVGSSSDPTKCKIIDTLIRDCWQRDCEIEVNEGLVKLCRERCRKKVYSTIPYFNDCPFYLSGLLICSSIGVPKRKKIVIP